MHQNATHWDAAAVYEVCGQPETDRLLARHAPTGESQVSAIAAINHIKHQMKNGKLALALECNKNFKAKN